MMTFVECIEADQLRRVWPIMRQLRSNISEDEYLARIEGARAEGYRLFVLMEGDEPHGLIGWRLVNDLASGRSLYVDDLIVDERKRGRNHGQTLIGFARKSALDENCLAIRLSSAMRRKRAHAFYDREGFDRGGFAFKLNLAS